MTNACNTDLSPLCLPPHGGMPGGGVDSHAAFRWDRERPVSTEVGAGSHPGIPATNQGRRLSAGSIGGPRPGARGRPVGASLCSRVRLVHQPQIRGRQARRRVRGCRRRRGAGGDDAAGSGGPTTHHGALGECVRAGEPEGCHAVYWGSRGGAGTRRGARARSCRRAAIPAIPQRRAPAARRPGRHASVRDAVRHRQASDAVTVRHRQASDAVTVRHRQASDTVTVRHRQASDAVTVRHRQASDTVTVRHRSAASRRAGTPGVTGGRSAVRQGATAWIVRTVGTGLPGRVGTGSIGTPGSAGADRFPRVAGVPGATGTVGVSPGATGTGRPGGAGTQACGRARAVGRAGAASVPRRRCECSTTTIGPGGFGALAPIGGRKARHEQATGTGTCHL
jgi:hypothetical protein